MRVNVTSVPTRKGGRWGAPPRRVRHISQRVLRHTPAPEEPQTYTIRGPLDRIDATLVGIEPVPIRIGATGWFRTAQVSEARGPVN